MLVPCDSGRMPRLIDAKVNRRATQVAFSWKVDGDLESASSPWLLSVELIGGENGPIHRFGFRFRDGKVQERFYCRLDSPAMNHYVPDASPQRIGDTWQAVFPADDAVAGAGTWRAALSFDEPDNSNESAVEGTF